MENRIFNTIEEFKIWYNNIDISFDTTLLIESKNKEVEFIFLKKIERANLAGEMERYHVFSLQTIGLKSISKIQFGNENEFRDLSFSETEIMFEVGKENKNDYISLNSEKLILKPKPDIFKIAEPRLNKKTVFFKLNQSLPSPQFISTELSNMGYKSCFIGYFGEIISIDEISNLGYSGFSIRPIEENNDLFPFLGVCFCNAISDPFQSEFTLDLQNANLVLFWKSLLGVICKLNIESIKSGNVLFKKEDIENFKGVFEID